MSICVSLYVYIDWQGVSLSSYRHIPKEDACVYQVLHRITRNEKQEYRTTVPLHFSRPLHFTSWGLTGQKRYFVVEIHHTRKYCIVEVLYTRDTSSKGYFIQEIYYKRDTLYLRQSLKYHYIIFITKEGPPHLLREPGAFFWHEFIRIEPLRFYRLELIENGGLHPPPNAAERGLLARGRWPGGFGGEGGGGMLGDDDRGLPCTWDGLRYVSHLGETWSRVEGLGEGKR